MINCISFVPFLVADRPTFTQLIVLKNLDGRNLRIIDWITTFERSQCEDLAYLLLNNDVQVHKLVKISNNEEFVRKVLREWLALDDDDPNCKAVPRTWEDLAKCVTDCGLDGTLTKAIRDTCPQSELLGVSPDNELCMHGDNCPWYSSIIRLHF